MGQTRWDGRDETRRNALRTSAKTTPPSAQPAVGGTAARRVAFGPYIFNCDFGSIPSEGIVCGVSTGLCAARCGEAAAAFAMERGEGSSPVVTTPVVTTVGVHPVQCPGIKPGAKRWQMGERIGSPPSFSACPTERPMVHGPALGSKSSRHAHDRSASRQRPGTTKACLKDVDQWHAVAAVAHTVYAYLSVVRLMHLVIYSPVDASPNPAFMLRSIQPLQRNFAQDADWAA